MIKAILILISTIIIAGFVLIYFINSSQNSHSSSKVPLVSKIQNSDPKYQGIPVPKNFDVYQNNLYSLSTDLDKETANDNILFASEFRKYFSKNFFPLPVQKTNIIIYKDPTDFQSIQNCESTFGCYMHDNRLIITHSQSGLGTMAHELVHNFVDDGINNPPDWLVEGLPTFFEKLFGYYNDSNELVLKYGYSNPWRDQDFANAIENGMLNRPSLLTVAQHKSDKNAERFLSLYLYERGWLQPYLLEITSLTYKDTDASSIIKISNKTLSWLEEDWSKWLEQKISDAKNINSNLRFIPPSFVLSSKKQWDNWLNENNSNPLFQNIK